eukprot:TRINITY_DN21721_c0_g1_i1.p1 TRINITY_DN21721_c0_g1~~TRINITY_DN21721_c0_g1_i1.p1  ORF type:complete len:409 (-),score=36.03 TRINITY_DN21721_c0_g1_i1:111-1337(-)
MDTVQFTKCTQSNAVKQRESELFGGGSVFIDLDRSNTDFNISMKATHFSGNVAVNGGGVYLKFTSSSPLSPSSSVFNISDSTFTSCATDYFGSAIFLADSGSYSPLQINFDSVEMKDGYAAGGDGSFYCYTANSELRFDNVNITRNSAVSGAGLYLSTLNQPTSACKISVNNGKFVKNVNNGLYVHGPGISLQMQDSQFVNNSYSEGAGMHVANFKNGTNTTAVLQRCLFTENYVTLDAAAIFLDGYVSVNLSDCLIQNNTAQRYAAVFVNGGARLEMVEGTRLVNNTAGAFIGGISCSNGSFISCPGDECIISDNTAPKFANVGYCHDCEMQGSGITDLCVGSVQLNQRVSLISLWLTLAVMVPVAVYPLLRGGLSLWKKKALRQRDEFFYEDTKDDADVGLLMEDY